jgi:hypothetical protein
MSGTPTPKSSLGNTIKLYLFPVLVTILASLIWRDVTEMRSDIKSLLAQSSVDKTKIENLERDVRSLEQAVFNKKTVANSDIKDPLFLSLLFKHEDIYNVKDHIVKSN